MRAERSGIATDGASWYLPYNTIPSPMYYEGVLQMLPAQLRSGNPLNASHLTVVLAASHYNQVFIPPVSLSGAGSWATANNLGVYTLR